MDLRQNIRREESTNKLCLQTPGHESYLPQIRVIVGDLAHKVGFDEQEVAKIEMAVDEACSNVVKHAYSPDKEWCWQHCDPEIRLDIRTDGRRLVIEINDHGQRFDFASYRPADIEHRLREMKHNGYGIFIMRNFMDEVQYNFSEQTGNTLRMVKYLKKA
ncbi:MAG TPA: ATP-binding protein [Verrucomicrobiae bacterium]|nr:ATP-binding protein [Verrucomicrobiae bacterium]